MSFTNPLLRFFRGQVSDEDCIWEGMIQTFVTTPNGLHEVRARAALTKDRLVWNPIPSPEVVLTMQFREVIEIRTDENGRHYHFVTQPADYPEGLRQFNPEGIVEVNFRVLDLKMIPLIDEAISQNLDEAYEIPRAEELPRDEAGVSAPKEFSTDDYYSVLGIGRDASSNEIRQAYRQRAMDFHPDRHRNEGDEAIETYSARMSIITEAFEVLSDPETRKRYDTLGTAYRVDSASVFRMREPYGTECMFCAHSPVATVTFRRNVGMIFTRRYGRYDVRVCRDCGRSLGRDTQNSTMLLGWWGFISFFANIGAVLGNAGALLKIGRLTTPESPKDRVVRPLVEPMNPGRSIFRRTGVWTSAIAVVIAISLAANSNQGNQGSQASQGGQNASGLSHDWFVGACVKTSGSQIDGIAPCSSSTKSILGIVNSANSCPVGTQYDFKEASLDPQPGRYVCLD